MMEEQERFTTRKWREWGIYPAALEREKEGIRNYAVKQRNDRST